MNFNDDTNWNSILLLFGIKLISQSNYKFVIGWFLRICQTELKTYSAIPN
jgi:hypothetical protein